MIEIIGFLVLALAILGVFLGIGIRNNIRDRQLKQSLGAGLNLQPLSRLDHELAKQITSMYRPGLTHSLAVRNVFSRNLPEGQLYLYDIWESRNGYRGYLDQCAFAFISSRANLPRISLFPRQSLPGQPGGPLAPILTWTKSPSETEIRVGDPSFEGRYLLAGKDESAIRQVLKPALIDFLTKSPPLTLRAQGHVFTVSARDVSNGKKEPDLETARRLYAQALQIGTFVFG